MYSLDSAFSGLFDKIRNSDALDPARSAPMFYLRSPHEMMLAVKKHLPRLISKVRQDAVRCRERTAAAMERAMLQGVFIFFSNSSGSYTVWFYYHRLNDQVLYGAVYKSVEPKIADTERGIARIEDELKTASGWNAARLKDRLNETRTFLGELKDLREESLRIAALPYKPDLNDGVMINAAPLHGLFRLRTWAKDAEGCWKKLAKGDYDRAHLAYTIWARPCPEGLPDRPLHRHRPRA